jgi:hypothetical protein
MTDFLDTPFGEYHESPSTCHLEDATYDGIIAKMSLRMRNGQPERDDFDHKRVSVVVNVATSTGYIPLQRTMSMTFEASGSGDWSQFSQFIEAATGIPCGDPAQRRVTPRQIANSPIRVETQYNSRKAKTNIEKFLRPNVQRTGAAAPAGPPLPGPRRDGAAPAQQPHAPPPNGHSASPSSARAAAPAGPVAAPAGPARDAGHAPAARPTSARTFRSNDDPSPGGQNRLLNIKENDHIDEPIFNAIVTDVGKGKPFDRLSGPECAEISVKLRQHARSAA